MPAKEVIYQRYNDADLAAVGEEVSLENTYGTTRNRRWWYIAAAVLGLLIVAAGVILALRLRKPAPVASGLPERLDPFIAAALLREVRERADLTVPQRAAIDQDLAAIEHYHFSGEANGQPPPDLRALVEKWTRLNGQPSPGSLSMPAARST